jgi:hypothetical protein
MHPQQDQKAAAAHFAQYKNLIAKVARQAMGRVLAVEPSMEFDDVMAHLSVVYVKCAERFDESKGWKFSTYLQNACYHEVNRLVEKIEKERTVVSSMSAQGMIDSGDEGEAVDFYSVFTQPDPDLNPEEAVSVKQELLALFATMSDDGRKAVALLIAPPTELQVYHDNLLAAAEKARQAGLSKAPIRAELSLDVVCRFLRFTRKRAGALREELLELTNVNFPRLNPRVFG